MAGDIDRLNVTQKLTDGVTITITSFSDNVMISRLDFETGARAPLHHHPEDEVNTVLSGRFECSVDGVVQTMDPGDVVHVRKDQQHSLHAVDGGTVLTIWGPVRHDLLDIFVRGPGKEQLEG